MAVYNYTAMDDKGKEKKGTVDADTVPMAIAQVREMGFFPTKVAAQKTAGGKKGGAGQKSSGMGKELTIPFLDRISAKQLTLFTRQLSTLIDAGLAIVKSLRTLESQEKPGKMKRTVGDVASAVEGGASFSEALAKYPKTFTKLYVSMVRAGEAGGVLEVTLRRLAEFAEKQMSLQKKIKSAMIYPIFVVVAAGGIVTFLVTFILPTFAEMFADMGATLPGLTQALISLSNFMINRWYVLVGGLFFMAFMYKFLCNHRKTKYYMDFGKLKIPVFGTLVQRIVIARFSRTLGTLIASGVPILQALTITRDTVGSDVFAKAVMRLHDSIREGESWAPALQSCRGVFPGMVISMIDVGEETGSVDTMLNKIADTYDEEVDMAVEGMVSVIEPLMIMFMGGAVGIIVIALFLPLIEMGLLAGG